MSESLKFVPFVELTGTRRFGAALDLMNARNTVSRELGRELPFVDKIYQSPIKTYRRIGHIASLMHQGKIDAFMTVHDDKVQGVATLQPWTKEDSDYVNSVELSYWVRKQPSEETAIELGTAIVHFLLDNAPLVNAPHWMVTLPDDAVKQAVATNLGLIPGAGPKSYDIEDGVTEPRQHWVL